MMNKYFVFDTNSLISASILPNSANRKAINKAIELGEIALSEETFEEYKEVVFRKKFDKYFFNNEERYELFNQIKSSLIYFSPSESITACRDPKDNKFLELAVAAKACCIITGDNDLLALHPFRRISILSAGDFLLLSEL